MAANQTRTNILYVLMGLLALPALLALANTLSIGVLERTREIGMLRAVGATRGQVRRIILAESLLLAALGALGGLWLGYALLGASRGAGLDFAYIFLTLGIGLAAGAALLALLAAILPASYAARLDIIAAVRQT